MRRRLTVPGRLTTTSSKAARGSSTGRKPTQALKHAWHNAAPGGSIFDKFFKIAAMAKLGKEGMRKIAEVRCRQCGADIARMLRLPDATATAIYDLDELWNGSGHPCGLKGKEISAARADLRLGPNRRGVFHGLWPGGRVRWSSRPLRGVVRSAVGRCAVELPPRRELLNKLASDDLVTELSRWEPEDSVLMADEAGIDRVAEAFARVVDAKSPWTYQHSTRVAEVAVGVAQQFNCSPELQRDVRRAALLHDVGKLGVSNLILDKPEKLTGEELVALRRHPDYSQRILEQVEAFGTLADISGAHHERLDGRGYHRRR